MTKIDFEICRDTLRAIGSGLPELTPLVSMAWDGKLLRMTISSPSSGMVPFTMILDSDKDYAEEPAKLAAEFVVRAKEHFTATRQ